MHAFVKHERVGKELKNVFSKMNEWNCIEYIFLFDYEYE